MVYILKIRREKILNFIKHTILNTSKNLCFFVGCMFVSFSSFANLPVKHNNYVDTIRNIDFYSNKVKDKFANSLSYEYKSLALYKYQYANDLDDANHFAIKALSAYHGERVKPDNIYKRNLPLKNIVAISNSYDELLNILGTDIKNEYPQLMAEAQVKFDCWVESEEAGLKKQAVNCRNRFMKAKDKLLGIISNDCFKCKEQLKKKEETTISKEDKLKKFDGQHLNLPKWPNMPMIRNNPPKPVIMNQTSNGFIVANNNNQASLKEIKAISESIKQLEKEIFKLRNQKPSTQVLRTSQGEKTIVVSDPTNANKTDIYELKEILADMQKQINSANKGDIAELKNALMQLQMQLDELRLAIPEPIDNTDIIREDIMYLEEEILALSQQIENIEMPECEIPYNQMNQDDYMEEEIFDEPSSLLPYEVFFDWDKDNVDYKFLPQLKDIVNKALSSKETIIIQGHTDTSGDENYNKDLSNRRALAVAKIIESLGIPSSKITIQAMGSTDPKIPTEIGVKKPENRRVVIK